MTPLLALLLLFVPCSLASSLPSATQTSLRNLVDDLYSYRRNNFGDAIENLASTSTSCKSTGLEYTYFGFDRQWRTETYPVFKCDDMSRLTSIDFSLSPKPSGRTIQLTKYYMERWFSGMPDLTRLVLETNSNDTNGILTVDIVGNLSAPLAALPKLQTCVFPPPATSVCCSNGTSPAIPTGSPCLSSFVTRLNGGALQDQCVHCCTNQRHDSVETNVDCGGPCRACMSNSTAAACTNGIQDNAETSVDCGGGCPVNCCENGIRDPNEDGVDCGYLACGRGCSACRPELCNRRNGCSNNVNLCTTSASLEVCGNPDCAAKGCSNVFAGWYGRGCRLFEPIGICTKSSASTGTCRSSAPNATECAVIGRVETADAFVCDVACQRAGSCKAGETRQPGAMLASVCKTAGESCGDQLVCNRQGRCVPEPKCGACETFNGNTCATACTGFPCNNDVCVDTSDNDTCTATVASASPGVCTTFAAAKGVCSNAATCNVECTGSRSAIVCDAQCNNPTNPCVVGSPIGTLTAEDVCVGDGRSCGSGVCLLGGKCRAATPLSLFLERLKADATSSNTVLRDRVRAAASAFLISLPLVSDTADETWKTLNLHVSENATTRKRAMSDDLKTALMNDTMLTTLGWAMRETRPTTTTTTTTTTTSTRASGGNGTPGSTSSGASGTQSNADSGVSTMVVGSGTQGGADSGVSTTGSGGSATGGDTSKSDDALGDDESAEFPLAAVVGGIAGGLCLIILIAVVVLLVKRRRAANDHPSSLSAINSNPSTPATDSAALFFDEDDEPLKLKSETKESIYASATGLANAPPSGEYGKAPDISSVRE
jgi:hypothetical protein